MCLSFNVKLVQVPFGLQLLGRVHLFMSINILLQ